MANKNAWFGNAPASTAAASTAASRLANQVELLENKKAEKEIPTQEKTVEQLVLEAQRTHKDTTVTAQRVLRIVEDSKQMKNQMLGGLHDQSKKMERIDDKMHTMNEHLSYSEKVLNYMRRCCCLMVCDSCTGADPEGEREAEWRARSSQGVFDAGDRYRAPPTNNNREKRAAGPSGRNTRDNQPEGSEFRDPDTNMPAGQEKVGMKLANETQKQNEIIDQIHNGLDDLLDGAKMIQDELANQDKLVKHVEDKTDRTQNRIVQMNDRSQLRKYGKGYVPREREEESTFGLSKTDVIKLMYK